jgi:ribosomal protein S19
MVQIDLVHARARRRLSRGIKRKGMALLKKLRKAKKDCGPYDKPDVIKTHLRDMLIMPEMIGSIVGVHNGKVFTSVEVKADMVRTRRPATHPLALVCGGSSPRPARLPFRLPRLLSSLMREDGGEGCAGCRAAACDVCSGTSAPHGRPCSPLAGAIRRSPSSLLGQLCVHHHQLLVPPHQLVVHPLISASNRLPMPAGWPLPGRVLDLVQARASRSPRYWCHLVVEVHPAQVGLPRGLRILGQHAPHLWSVHAVYAAKIVRKQNLSFRETHRPLWDRRDESDVRRPRPHIDTRSRI